MKTYTLPVAVLCLLPFLSLAAEGEVPRLINEDGPEQGTATLALEELWRVGGEDEDVIFGRIVALKRHEDGNIYVLDNQMCQVTVISPDGEYLQTISREGDGPGELRQPMAVTFLADDVLALGMGFPGKIITLGLDGTPGSSLFPIGEPAQGNIGVMMSSKFRDGFLVSSGGRIVFQDQNTSYTDRFLTVGQGDFTDFHRVLETTTPVDPTGIQYSETDNYYIDFSWDLGPQGTIFAPMERDAYEVSVFDHTGKLLRVFGRPYKQRKRTQEEIDSVSPTIDVAGRTEGRRWVIDDHFEAISNVQYNHDEGTVWVLTPHQNADLPDDILQIWDIFSPDGKYLKQVSLPLGNEITDGTLYLIGGGRLIVVRGTASSFHGDNEQILDDVEIEPLEVICYRVK